MRYSFQLLNSKGGKIDEFIKLSARLANGWRLGAGQTLVVCDNRTAAPPIQLHSQEQIEAWLQDLAIMESRMRESANCATPAGTTLPSHIPWNPFEEHEWLAMAGKEPAPNSTNKLSYKSNADLAAEVSAKAKAALVDSNLKTAAAVGKPQVSGVPPIAIMALGAAMQNGVDKYGRFNWRATGVTSSVFYDAMMRHLVSWHSGEQYADDSKVHHLAHLMAGCAILLDAELHKCLNDDRDLTGHKVTPTEQSLYKAG